jgi:hypothetical protein
MFQKIVKFLIIVGTASLIYFQPITEAGEFSLATIRYRSDFVFLAAVGLWVVSRVLGLIRPNRDSHARLTRWVFAWMWLFVMFTTLATLLSLVTYDLWFEILGLSSLVKILLGIILTQVAYENLKGNSFFYQWLARALYLPMALVLALGVLWLVNPSILPGFFLRDMGASVGGQLALVGYGSRFLGVASNPAQVVLAAVVALSFVWTMLLHNIIRGKWRAGLVQSLYSVGLIFLVFWSLTRAGLIVLVFALGFGSFMTWYCLGRKKNFLGFPPLGVMIALLAIWTTWNVLPQEIRRGFLDRFSEPDARLYIWRYYWDIALANPLGVGFNYEQMFEPMNPYSAGRLNPHNALLAAWMYGGIGGLLSLVIFLLLILKSIKFGLASQRQQGYVSVLYIGAVTALFSTWVLFMFIGGVPIAEFTHSILLALVLAGSVRHAEIPVRSLSTSKVHGPRLAASIGYKSSTSDKL